MSASFARLAAGAARAAGAAGLAVAVGGLMTASGCSSEAPDGATPPGEGAASGTGSGDTQAACAACESMADGAPNNECLGLIVDCLNDSACQGIHACIEIAPCEADTEAGACCKLNCVAQTIASQASINMYRAYDSCVYCKTCKGLCDTEAYCAVFEQGQSSSCGQ